MSFPSSLLAHVLLLKASVKGCLSDGKMDSTAVWRQEQVVGAAIRSLPATGHILEGSSPTVACWLELS